MSRLFLPHSELNIRPLYYFLHVAEAGSLSRAASILSKDQPSLSKEIRGLEQLYGVQLFHRTGRGMVLTSEGEALARHARIVVRAVTSAREEMDSMKDTLEGPVVIAVPPLLGQALNVRLVKDFRDTYPKVTLSFQEGFSTDILAWLAEGTVDVAVVYNAPKVSTLLAEFLVEDQLYVIGETGRVTELPDGEVDAACLAQIPLVIAPRPHKLRLIVEEAVHRHGCDLTIANEVSGTATTLELVRHGIGFTVLPRSLVLGALSQGGLDARSLGAFGPLPRLYLANSMQKPLTAAARQVTIEIKRRFQEVSAEHHTAVIAPA